MSDTVGIVCTVYSLIASSFIRSSPSAFELKNSRKSSLIHQTLLRQPKYDTHASMVAEEMMTRSSGRFFVILGCQRGRVVATHFLTTPSSRSV